MGYFRFFFYTDRTFYCPVPRPAQSIKSFCKKSFKFLFIKSKKFYSDNVKNESAKERKLEGGGRQRPPTPV